MYIVLTAGCTFKCCLVTYIGVVCSYDWGLDMHKLEENSFSINSRAGLWYMLFGCVFDICVGWIWVLAHVFTIFVPRQIPRLVCRPAYLFLYKRNRTSLINSCRVLVGTVNFNPIHLGFWVHDHFKLKQADERKLPIIVRWDWLNSLWCVKWISFHVELLYSFLVPMPIWSNEKHCLTSSAQSPPVTYNM